ncbi:MAG: hypothetical protein MUO26_10115 [Methanotrichaceae archaeon]|nr:hypothetical protein [Methanotrichaceae archaeon]
MNWGAIVILMGVFVVITGIALVGVQVLEGKGQEIKEHSFKLIGAEAGSKRFQVETSFPGLPVIALGVILLISGAAISRL